MWVWTEETQNIPSELKRKLFQAKDKHGKTAWHIAALGGSLDALETIWSWAKEVELNTDELLLAQSGDGLTAFQLAAEKNHVETLKRMWAWAEETRINPNDLKKNLFQAKDNYGFTAWQRAAFRGRLEAFHLLWIWAKDVETNPDKLLLSNYMNNLTAFQLASYGNHQKLLHYLFACAENAKLNPNVLRNKLIQDKHKYRNIALLRARRFGSLDSLQIIQIWAKEAEVNPDEFLLAEHEEGTFAPNWQRRKTL
jgi:ankyrin repeat protein